MIIESIGFVFIHLILIWFYGYGDSILTVLQHALYIVATTPLMLLLPQDIVGGKSNSPKGLI